MAARAPVTSVEVAAYRIPTDRPESDGTLAWDSTTLVLVEVAAGGRCGLGYTYADAAAARLIAGKLAEWVRGRDAFDVGAVGADLWHAVRNLGRSGIAACAISAVDNALWDLKARLLEIPLSQLLGVQHPRVPLYGSGGFTSYSDDELAAQLGGWVEQGLGAVKMKVGRDPGRDPQRVRIAREAIGPDAELFVDANGAYPRQRAAAQAQRFAEQGVSWFEEPVSSDDVEGLRFLRHRVPPGMEVSAGEYGFTLDHFRRLLEHGAVDVLQADVTRCGGISGFLQVAALCEAYHVPLSVHTAPLQSLAVAAASRPLRHLEWFHDHVRIEGMLFEGLPRLERGELLAAGEGAGLGVEFRRPDAERFRVAF